MGKPAARLGDMCMHGGAIVVGCPMVLIGGMPAARIGDMHVCPMMTPAGPAPIPHVGAPVSLGSPMVLIGGMPAARMGDMAVCVGPPDTIALGCMTVLIGEGGSGAAGAVAGGGAGAPASIAANYSAATAVFDNKESTTKQEHWIEFQFVDKAGNPVSGVNYKFTDPSNKESEGVLRLDGTIRRDALKAGQCKVQLFTVSNAKWSKDNAEVGEKVKMTADVEGFQDGTKATFQIWQKDISAADKILVEFDSTVKGNKIEAEWSYNYNGKDEDPVLGKDSLSTYFFPQLYFILLVQNCESHSSILKINDVLHIFLTDEKGNPVANEPYIVYLSNGEIRKGNLDGNGEAKEKNIPSIKSRVFFPNISGVKKIPE